MYVNIPYIDAMGQGRQFIFKNHPCIQQNEATPQKQMFQS